MLDPALSVRIVLGPETDELLQVVWAENTPVSREVVEVVHDDGHEQVNNEERAEHEEGDEVGISEVDAAQRFRIRLVVVTRRVALDILSLGT